MKLELRLKEGELDKSLTRSFDNITPEDIDRWRSGNYTFNQCFPDITKDGDRLFIIQALSEKKD